MVSSDHLGHGGDKSDQVLEATAYRFDQWSGKTVPPKSNIANAGTNRIALF